MRLPNLLATARGRLAAFFLLYVTEGIPLGFAATAVATQLRRQGVGPAEIGAFVGLFYLPWAFKWAYGPLVDVFASARWGRRRGWILGMQFLMVGTLLSTVLLDLPQQLALFSGILVVHNIFSATQDVAIDALAVNTLREHERATASGLMFAGASLGQMIGGSGALFIASHFGFQTSFYFVCGSIMLVTLLVVLPFKEPADPEWEARRGGGMKAAAREMREFAVTAFRSFVGTRGAFAGLGMALLPPGAMCLGLALQSNIAVELGLNDDEVAWLNICTGLINAAGCIIGGVIADRTDRRKALTWYILLMSIPVLVMAGILQQQGWILPVNTAQGEHRAVPAVLITTLWVASLAYNFCNGLMYSTTTAVYMDVTNPKVAGTQFTAYMAMFNLTISYSATWQGISSETWGYPVTMLVDGFFGLCFLLLLPLTRRRPTDPAGFDDRKSSGRARALAWALAVLCLLWPAVQAEQSVLGSAQPIADTVFSLVFVASALLLLAGGTMLDSERPVLARAARWAALPLLALLLRSYAEHLPAALQGLYQVVALGAPLLAAVLLWQLARRPWQALVVSDAAEPATA